MFARSAIRALVLLGLSASASTATTSCSSKNQTHVSVRLPPTFGTDPEDWEAPPVGWDFGYWYQTNSSTANEFMRNLQYYTGPIDDDAPTGLRDDLASFQVTGNDTVLTSYGVDTPSTTTPAVYTYAGTGILTGATDSLEIIAWGYDCHNVGYRVSFSSYTAYTNTPASIDFLSRTKAGPSSNVLSQIKSALIAFGNANVTALAEKIGPGVQDDGRDGMPPVDECDAYCKSNEDLLGLIGA